MQKYRTIPFEVEAMQFTEENREAIIQWTDCRHKAIDDDGCEYETANLFLDDRSTLGVMVRLGEWVVRGVDGGFFRLTPEVFEKAYAPVRLFPSDSSPPPGPLVDETALLFAEILTTSRKLEDLGYKGLAVIKALPELMELLRQLQTAEGYCSLKEVQSDAFYYLDSLTRKETPDDAA